MPGALRRRNLIGLPALLALAGCGFTPLYGRRGDAPGPAEAGLGLTDVALIPERTGQLLRQDLQARFDHGNAPAAKRYQLVVSFSINSEGLGIAPDTTTTRVRFTGRAQWTLRRLDPTGATLVTGAARAVDSLNTFDQQYFAQDIESQTVERRIIREVASEITEQLALWFRKHPA